MKKKKNVFVGAILITIVLGFFQLPFSSFMADDLIQIGVLEEVSPSTWLGPLDLYTLSDGNPEHMRILKDAGAFQWFWNPEFKAKFFRPLSSLLLGLDHWIFGLNPVGYSIHNILWFLLLVVAAGFLMRRFLPGRTGTLAIFIFAVSGIHWYVVYWAAARHIIVASAVGLWSLLAYIKWREQGWRYGRFIAVLGIILSLSAGEAALGILAYLFAYEFLATDDRFIEKLKKIFPFAAVVVIYFILYKAFGYGAFEGGGYLNPLTGPLQFLSAFPVRFLVLTGSMFAGGNTELWMIPSIRPFIMFFCALVIILMLILLRKISAIAPGNEKKPLRWLLAGSFLSLLPFSAAPPGARSLVIPFIGGAVIVAFILSHWWTVLRKSVDYRVIFPGMICWILLLVHLVFAPLQRIAGPIFAKEVFADRLHSFLKDVEYDREQAQQKFIFLTVPDFSIGFHSYYFRRLNRQPMPESWWVLSWETCVHRVFRSRENVLELELIDGSIKRPFLKKGTQVELTDMEITVLKTNEEGATHMEFRFDRSLDDPSLTFFAWLDGRFKPIRLPPVGEEMRF
jgi:hypothetical protein